MGAEKAKYMRKLRKLLLGEHPEKGQCGSATTLYIVLCVMSFEIDSNNSGNKHNDGHITIYGFLIHTIHTFIVQLGL
jgi:hypothetical protein